MAHSAGGRELISRLVSASGEPTEAQWWRSWAADAHGEDEA